MMYYVAVECEHNSDKRDTFLHPYDKIFFDFETMKSEVERHSRMCPACTTILVFEYDASGRVSPNKHWKVQNCLRSKSGQLVEVAY